MSVFTDKWIDEHKDELVEKLQQCVRINSVRDDDSTREGAPFGEGAAKCLEDTLNTAKEILAYELTKLVHGEEEANKAQEVARGLFAKGGDTANMPSTALSAEDLTDGSIGILDLMLRCGLVPSKGEARRLVQQGGVEVAGEKVKEISAAFTAEQLSGEGLVIKKGKKVFHRAYLAS